MPAQEFFTPVAFDFLWEDAGVGEPPYPLRVRSHGAHDAERRMLRQRAREEFAARGIDRDAVQEQLALLAKPSISIDALHIPEYRTAPIAALAASDGTRAVLAIQDDDGFWLRSIYPDGIASAIVELLPRCARGTESALTLPLEQALHTRPATAAVTAGAAADSGGRGVRRAGRSERPDDPAQAYAQIIAQPRLRGGQLAANSRDDLGGKQRSPVLAWFDTATGRYLSLSVTGADGREWVTVAPADPKTLRTRLGEMISDVTR